MFPDFFVSGSQQKTCSEHKLYCYWHLVNTLIHKISVLLLNARVLLQMCSFRILTVGMENAYTFKDTSDYEITVEVQ